MPDSPPTEAASNVLSAHIRALNSHNATAIAATLHFPHFRLSGTVLKTWDSPEDYWADFRQRAGSRWHRSEFQDIQAVAASDDKVHFNLEVVRFDGHGAEIARFRSLWVVTMEGGVWAAKFRSSFAHV